MTKYNPQMVASFKINITQNTNRKKKHTVPFGSLSWCFAYNAVLSTQGKTKRGKYVRETNPDIAENMQAPHRKFPGAEE